MAITKIKVKIHCDIQKVWETVTSLENYSWRSDLCKIEVVSERQFIEHTKDGYATTFTTVMLEMYKRWEFDMENSNIKGHWIGVFSQKDGFTEIEFTESATAKKWFLIPFVKAYLKKQQEIYISDLKKALLRK